MKDPLDRTKLVLRHLPPALSQSALVDQIDSRFLGRYHLLSFHPGKNSQKMQQYSRAYINLKRPEDVLEFAEFFDGHVFVNEKGAQFKAMVEYAPSQRVPKPCSKKDGREGTIYKDPEYLEFLELLAKPAENLPSAEIQLERREAERAGAPKEACIVTPLMDFIRQKRAAKNGFLRAPGNGKLSRRAGVASGSSSSRSSKRGPEKRRGTTLIYVSRDTTKGGGGKDKSSYTLVSRREEQRTDKPVAVASANGANVSHVTEDGTVTDTNGSISGVPGVVEVGKKKLVLLKGKERESSYVSGGLTHQQSITPPIRNSDAAGPLNQRQEASGRIIRRILSHKEGCHNASYGTASQAEKQMQTLNLEKDRRPPRPSISHSFSKDRDNDNRRYIEDKVVLNEHGLISNSEKNERRMRNKDRPDRGVWTPLRRSDGSHASEENLSSSSITAKMSSDSLESIQGTEVKVGTDDTGFPNIRAGRGGNSLTANGMPLGYGEIRHGTHNSSRSAEIKSLGGGRVILPPVEIGSHRHVGRRGPALGPKEVDNYLSFAEGKPSKRVPTGYGSHERQVWVQKSGSAS